MKDRKTIYNKILFPPLWVLLILTVFSAAALVVIFVKGWEQTLPAYAIYVVAFYWVCVLSLACWKTIPGYFRSVKGKVHENPYAHRYLTDAVFKTHVSLYISLAINLLYIATNAVSAIIYHTAWFAIFAVYYAIMAVMRFLLVRYVNRVGIGKDRMGELKRSRLCAYILIVVNLLLSGVVLMMVYHDRRFEYQGILIYVMAMYTFWITTRAIIDLFKYKKYASPVMSTSKIIKLASAMMSMLSLETAMFSQFGADSSPHMQQIMIMATGGGIAIIVSVMAVYVIVRNTLQIKKLKNNIS